jgi:heme exporter protein B
MIPSTLAILKKEFQSELRARSGMLTAGLFALVTVIALAFASFGRSISGSLASGLIWAALLFTAVIALPRSFIVEEEQGTGDLLRLWAKPVAIFWGKSIFNLLQMFLLGLVLATLYVGLAGLEVKSMGIYVLALGGGCAALSGTVTLCGALVAQAQNRTLLAGAVALPLLIPLVFLGVAAMRFAFGEGSGGNAVMATSGLWLYALAAYAMGPTLFEAVWKP